MTAKDIERLAEIVYAASPHASTIPTDPRCETCWEHSQVAVRAILQALGEPSEEMVIAAQRSCPIGGIATPVFGAAWQAMIDHLLAG